MWNNIPPEIREQIVGFFTVVMTALGVSITLVIRFYAQKLMFQKASENMIQSIQTHGNEDLKQSVKAANEVDGIEKTFNTFVKTVKENG